MPPLKRMQVMKMVGGKVKFIRFCRLAVIVLWLPACTETSVDIINGDVTGDARIGFGTPGMTRAAGVVNDFTAGSAFSVWSWYVPADADSEVFRAATVSTPDGSTWGYEGTRYWKAGRTYSFYALYPTSGELTSDGAVVSAGYEADGTLSLEGFDATVGYDLMAASARDMSGDTPEIVPLGFKHLLARVEFVGKRSVATEDLEGFVPRIHSIRLYGMYKSGNFSAKVTDVMDNAEILAGWSFPDGSLRTTSEHPFASYDKVQEVTTDGVSTVDVLLFPQNIDREYCLEVTYSSDEAGHDVRRSEVYLASLPLAVWEAGKHYRYTFTISDNDRILFDTPTVNAWTEAVGGIIIVD